MELELDKWYETRDGRRFVKIIEEYTELGWYSGEYYLEVGGAAKIESWKINGKFVDSPEDEESPFDLVKEVTYSDVLNKSHTPKRTFLDRIPGLRKPTDNVNNPVHYNKSGIECIDAIEAATGEGFEFYLQGNILKYLWRYRYKNGVEDLKKARWYLDKLIGYKE